MRAYFALAAPVTLPALAADMPPAALSAAVSNTVGGFASGGIVDDDPIEVLLENYNLQLVFAEKGHGGILGGYLGGDSRSGRPQIA